MDGYLLSVIIFIFFLALIVYWDRKHIKREAILLLRKTKRGRRFLIRLGTGYPRFWRVVGTVGVIVGFVMSVWIFWQFLLLTAQNLSGEIAPGVGLVLPSPTAAPQVGPGYFGVPFWYWIIIIGLLALVHEGMHGIMAAMEKVKIKSLGWGLLLVLPLAFVEPDEAQLTKKPAWAQLRVFAAGSFANFLLAGVALVIGMFVAGMFVPAGVVYQGYPGTFVAAGNITTVNGVAVADVYELRDEVGKLENGTLVELVVNGKIFYSRPERLLAELGTPDKVGVFEGYSAFKGNLTGMIIEINGKPVNSNVELDITLEEIGPGQNVTIVTTDGKENKTFQLVTVEEPEPVFRPGVGDYIAIGMEHAFPEYTSFSRGVSDSAARFFGAEPREDWRSLTLERKFWEWVRLNYPELRTRANWELERVGTELEEHPRAGFIGISSVGTFMAIRSGLEPFSGPIHFVNGLLLWMFLINFGVGAFNLLPIRPLDGGRMWEILLKKIAPNRAHSTIRTLSVFTLFLIVLNFVMILGVAA